MEEITTQRFGATEKQVNLKERFLAVRSRTEEICKPLQTEDYVVQPSVDVSPPKWHLAHTSWFFETFFLPKAIQGYIPFDKDFNYLFNSYYETIGKRVLRADRGNITRPGVDKIYAYRAYVNTHVVNALQQTEISDALREIIILGMNHEMQHQELLYSDIKFILGHNPIFPIYNHSCDIDSIEIKEKTEFLYVDQGIYEIGFSGEGFSFDNELNKHSVYLHDFEIASQPVLFGEFIEFIEDGGYQNFKYWHNDGWTWVNENKITAPLYMFKVDGKWHRYTLAGFKVVNPHDVLLHISFYEASAFATWKGMRLPTEFEWEAASDLFKWGDCWEWTNSAYLPYPGFHAAPGAIGEYNGKFMVNQMVLRGASKATSAGHSRKTYRNFFHPYLQWQYAGLRLAK